MDCLGLFEDAKCDNVQGMIISIAKKSLKINYTLRVKYESQHCFETVAYEAMYQCTVGINYKPK